MQNTGTGSNAGSNMNTSTKNANNTSTSTNANNTNYGTTGSTTSSNASNASAQASGNTSANANLSSDKMGEKELVTDLLNSEKLLCNTYNTAVLEAATPGIRENFKNILMDQFDVQNTVFMAMSSKGWYPVEAAESNKIQQTKNQYPNSVLNA